MTRETTSAQRSRSTTLRDVAKAAGVDVSTVSRVLKNDKDVRTSAETRQRIIDAAERLKYRANPLARALKTAQSRTLLIVVPQIENPVFASAILGAEAEARARGYVLLVAYDQNGSAASVLERVSQSSLIEGVIIASFDEDDSLRQSIAAMNRPYVVINRVLPGDVPCVAVDTCAASAIGVRHLIDLGHRRIGHVAGRLGRFNGNARRQGWEEAMSAAGLDPDPQLVAEAGYDPERVPAAVDRLLDRKVTAIHAATLLTGAATIAHLHKLGLDVPGDISVVTMHDDLLARVVYPEITTVGLPTSEMGHEAVRMLVDQLVTPSDAASQRPPVLLLAPGNLVVRGSASSLKI
ncbi:LacI family DNA-binding transcriptional regulator [Stappia sp.]|uniref:LacI family DNA-binding transcriptional regulator n=1 Tax=Stappia sp. TaxID=1870903 RepID=UPI003D09C79E